MSYKAIAGTIPTFMAAGLLGENLKELRRKKPRLVRMGIRNIIGTSMIQSTAQITGGL